MSDTTIPSWYVPLLSLSCMLFVLGPVGAVLGHVFRNRALEGWIMGAFLGVLGFGLIFLLPKRQVEKRGDLPSRSSAASTTDRPRQTL
jgi:hypothetical protein